MKAHFTESSVNYALEKYADSVAKIITAHFLEDALSVLQVFSIFNIERFSTEQNSQEFKVSGTKNTAILIDH